MNPALDRPFGGAAGADGGGRSVLLGAGVFFVVFGYLAWMITRGAGLLVGDEGYWLIQGRDAFRRLPNVAGSLVPLTDIIVGAWSNATAPLGLVGARLGWAVLNSTAATLVYFALARVFPAGRVAVALVVAVPMICSQQFMTLEYTNVPWFLLLMFALAFVESGKTDLPSVAGYLWSLVAGAALAAAVLSRMLVLPALLLPLWGWVMAGRRSRFSSLMVCYASTAVVLTVGAAWLWRTGALAETFAVIQETRNLGSDAGSEAGKSYSNWRMASLYLQNTIVGIEQFAVIAVGMIAYVLYARAIDRSVPRAAALVRWLPLVAVVLAVAAAPKFGPGVFNPRFLSGLPAIVLTFCMIELWRLRKAPGTERDITVRQFLLFGIAIPILVMVGSNLGFYRMISGSWLAIPLALLLIPDAAASAGALLATAAWQDRTRAEKSIKQYLYFVAIAMLVYATSYGLIHGFASDSPLTQTARMRYPKLSHIHEAPGLAAEYDSVLGELQTRVAPGDVILAYPHLEMMYWLTDTNSPLRQMFVHSRDSVIRSALAGSTPRCIVFHDNSRDPLWTYSVSRRAVVDEYIAANGYAKVWENGHFVIFERQP